MRNNIKINKRCLQFTMDSSDYNDEIILKWEVTITPSIFEKFWKNNIKIIFKKIRLKIEFSK